MQGANLLIISDTALSIQSGPQYSHTFTPHWNRHQEHVRKAKVRKPLVYALSQQPSLE